MAFGRIEHFGVRLGGLRLFLRLIFRCLGTLGTGQGQFCFERRVRRSGRVGIGFARNFHRQAGLVARGLVQRIDQCRLLGRRLDQRQLVQRGQAEIVEKLPRGGVERRPAHGFAVADHLDPAAVLELLQDEGVDGDAANVFHVAARDRLAVGNDGQRFEGGARVARRLLWVQAIEVVAHLRPALKAPAAGDVHQLQAALRPVFLQFKQQHLDGVHAQLVVEQHAHVAHWQRLARTDQGGF